MKTPESKHFEKKQILIDFEKATRANWRGASNDLKELGFSEEEIEKYLEEILGGRNQ